MNRSVGWLWVSLLFPIIVLAQDSALPPPPGEEEAKDEAIMSNSMLYLKVGQQISKIPVPTDFDKQGSPKFSPDGTRLAYDAWNSANGGTFRECKVVICDPDGFNAQIWGTGSMPSFSPDNKHITYSSYQTGAMIGEVKNSKNSRIIDESGWSPRWSPDGKYIAYTKHLSKGSNICLYEVATGKKRMLLQGEEAKRYYLVYWNFDWSQDSQTIVFRARLHNAPDSRKSDLAIVDVGGSKKGFKVLWTNRYVVGHLSFHSSNPKEVYFSGDEEKISRNLIKINTETLEFSKFPELPTQSAWVDPSWHPSGKMMVLKGVPKKTK